MKRNMVRTTLRIFSFATLLAGLSSVVQAQLLTTGCSLSTLKGTYTFQAQGTIIEQLPGFPTPPFPFAEVAVDVLDGAGNISGKFTANVGGVNVSGTVAGTYTVNLDCTGTFSMQTDSGIPIHEVFVVLPKNALGLVQTDSYIVITRTMQKM